MKRTMIPAADMIERICFDLEYSRSHVAAMMRRHYVKLKAKKQGRRWYLPIRSERSFKDIVQRTSGRRYKLGETGSRA